MEALEARDDAPLVVLAGRWALAATGVRVGDTDRPGVTLVDTDAGDHPPTNVEAFRRGLARTVARIRATGREVLIVASLPEMSFDVPNALAATAMWGRPPPAPPDRAAVAARNATVAETFAELERSGAARAVSLIDVLCAPECRIVADGRPLYRDSHHVSTFGATTVIAPALLRSALFEDDVSENREP
jgi:hypothetical protein